MNKTPYNADFLLWDVEDLVTKEFKDKNNRICDLHKNAEFQELLKSAQESGQEGKVHEIVSDLFIKFARVIRNPECI